MKNKNFFKNFIYIFCAFCLFAAGSIVLQQHSEIALAETETVEIDNQNLPSYFLANEYLINGESSKQNKDSLIAADTFLFYQEGSTSTKLSLSLKQNGHIANKDSLSDVYTYCYYPDESDPTYFHFYKIRSVSLFINGVDQNINMGDFAKASDLSFVNYDSAQPDSFEMNFTNSSTSGNNICVLDSRGNVIEGVYTLSLQYTLYTCNDGKVDASEERTSFSDTNPPAINYSFYVVSRENYFKENHPDVNSANFDHTVEISSARNPDYAYYLYSNYSSNGGSNQNDAYKTPYIEYDYTRFDLEITKELSEQTTLSKILYNTGSDTEVLVTEGENLVELKIDKTNKKCKVFFLNVGNYSVKFLPFKLIEQDGSVQKYALSGVASVAKKYMVYMYGYQANYTDMDKPLDADGIRQTSELKHFDQNSEKFTNSADITSGFLNSNASYSQDTANTTFLIGNILNYINTAGKDNTLLTPTKTNQTPIRFTLNANLYQAQTAYSYIYSTTRISNAYEQTNATLDDKKLYRTKFTGRTESTAGTYIYIIPYTFDNYYETATSNRSDKLFYQVFYFEITKELPSISIKTESNKVVYSQTFVNENVKITNDTANDTYNKDVTIRIYAQNFDRNGFVDGFGGSNGITFEDLGRNLLSANAHYTIRLYFSNEMTSSNIAFSSTSGFFREQSFTIDKTEISNITGTNVTELTNSTDFRVGSLMDDFTTNQSMVISWDKKASGAKTFAYYRYFPLVQAQYYSNRETVLSTTINRMLNNVSSYLPVNYVLDMSTTGNNWISYYGNAGLTDSSTTKSTISAEYVLSDSGLYLLDVYDEAGNHSVEVFFIDNTSPIFALRDETKYYLTSPSMYLTSAATLYWARYKAIYIANWSTVSYNSTLNGDNITEEDLKNYDFYKTYNNQVSISIFKAIYNRLKANNYLQSIECNVSFNHQTDGVSDKITSYSGNYITIPINNTSYYMDGDDGYKPQENVYSQAIAATGEMTYRVLIRDLSNTKFDSSSAADPNHLWHYTNYYSARQTIKVSFDSSEFAILYESDNNEWEDLTININNSVEGETSETENQITTTYSTKTTYIAPTSMDKQFVLSFLPTTSDGDLLIQVKDVTIKYYSYVSKTVTKEIADAQGNKKNITYSYLELSENPTEINVYSYNSDSDKQTTVKQEPIKLNSNGKTTEGKYEITRTYLVDESHSYNANDFYKRTFVLYVDRNEVITNADRIADKSGNYHTESLVGGDVFVAMYDNKQNASLVVTFPNSPDGNTNGASLYNNGNVKSILSTNMLPVYVYIPQVKYTTNAQKKESSDSYDFEVAAHDKMNIYADNNHIFEYLLYAEIYKDGLNNNNLIARSSSDRNNIASKNGFLTFTKADGNPLSYLKDAGTYYVKLYQGRFGLELGENRYEQSITFSFEIQKSNPDFTVQSTTGKTLNSEIKDGLETYHTNQNVVNVLWDAGSTYMAEIDIDATSLKTSNRTNPYSLNDDILDRQISLPNGKYIAELNLEKLGIYQNNAYVDITMQYKNHDDKFYDKVTKRIYVDLSAPSDNVQNLVEKSTASRLIPSLSNDTLRTYYTAHMASTKDPDNTSYNVSNTNTFAYYSYNVTSDFLDVLKANNTYKTYVRAFVDSSGQNTKYRSGFSQETNPAEFLASSFNEIDSFTGFEKGKYYEIVEMDMAENMSIYTIYVVDYKNANLITYTDGEGQKHSYTSDDYQNTKSYPNALHSIYSPTGFVLNDINYFGDAWAQIKFENVNINGFSNTMYLMLSPWRKGYAYAYSGSNVTEIALENLVNGLTSSRFKSVLHIYNREIGDPQIPDDFYINIRNTDFSATLTGDKTREYIRFAMPSDQAIQDKTYASLYLTSLKIYADGALIFKQENKPGFASLWQSTDKKILVSADQTARTITFEIDPALNFEPNTRIVYEYTDNYGKPYKEIHLYNEDIITQEIASNNDLYAYYDGATGKLIYLTKDGFKYNYNPSKYNVKVYDYINEKQSTETTTRATVSDDKGTVTITTKNDTNFYNDTFVLEITSKPDASIGVEEEFVKSIYFKLYNQLPTANYPKNQDDQDRNNNSGEFKLLDASRNNITKTIISNENSNGYFSEVTVMFSQRDTFIPIKYSISRNGTDWEEISSGTRLRCTSNEMEKYYLKVWYDETYLLNETGLSTYVFGVVPPTQVYEFNLSSLTSTFWVEKTVNGTTEIVQKDDSIWTGADGRQCANHYIVNVSYDDLDSVVVQTNKEHNIEAILQDENKKLPSPYSNDVFSDYYLITNGDDFKVNIVITFIPASENFVGSFYTFNTNGIIDKTENLINMTSKTIVISENYSSLDRVELQWSKYYGVPQNEIDISLVKDGIELTPTVYTRKDDQGTYNYIYLTYSGKYTIKLFDHSGNVQKFNYGNAGQSETFNFVFLKDVPFTVTYTDVETEQEETTLPIKQAVYNGNVSINIDKASRSDFYASNGYPTIVVKRNGKDLTEEQISALTEEQTGTTKYNFTDPGYYEVYFLATSNIPEVGTIRHEVYQFTILNANEYRYAYIYNKYSNYYVEKVIKNGKDITNDLIETLDVSLTAGKMSELPLSYLDEKTGAGVYLITINSNDSTFASSGTANKFTFKVIIQVGSAPIRISLPEGEATTKDVSVTYNASNIYQEMGECEFRIVSYSNDQLRTYTSRSIDSTVTDQFTETISGSSYGTYYIQIVSPSGNLLYSYKVVKDEPMNPASIIAIVISAIVAIVVIVIVIKLRKRISVK